MSRHVRERFPDYGARINNLYESDHEFRALCHDYGVCIEQLGSAKNSQDGQNIALRVEQLLELQADLESDIAEYLMAHHNPES